MAMRRKTGYENSAEKELKQWFYDFETVYNITILSPKLYGSAKIWFTEFKENQP